MFQLLLSIAFLVVAALLFISDDFSGRVMRSLPTALSQRSGLVKSVFLVGGLYFFISLSFVYIGKYETGHLDKVYGSKELSTSAIIATQGEKGPQSEILMPGFQFRPFLNFIYKIEKKPSVIIRDGHYGLLVAKDGIPLRETQFIADAWKQGSEDKMLDASYFLTQGKGQQGPQLFVLKPGIHRINRYLFDIKELAALDVKTGHVAVIRSNVQTKENCPSAIGTAGGSPGSNLSATIVPKGCFGVWEEALPPGRYYLNANAYVSTIIPTRVQVWSYKGGYETRQVDLSLNDDGKIVQTETPIKVPKPADAADKAINVRVEGWKVPIEARIVVQVNPKLAPRVVASTGSLENVENNIITPSFRDLLRTIGGREGRKVMDFVEKRADITKELEAVLVPEGLKAGISIQEVRLGEPALPPEVLIPGLRKQLANSLKETYKAEKIAQLERVKVEQTRAEADQQKTLMTAQIGMEAAQHTKEQQRLLGEGEQLRLTAIAKGQKAQADVIGKEETARLKALEMSLAAAIQNPDIVKVPSVNVQSSGGTSLEGAAAVLRGTGILGTSSTLNTSAR